MFISYRFNKYDISKDGIYIMECEITDSEFGTAIVNTVKGPTLYIIEVATAVIQEYSKRNLNVAANLALAFVWYNEQYPIWSTQKSIDYNKMENPFFLPYEQDLQKYLVLL
jgi:hypothetical protein